MPAACSRASLAVQVEHASGMTIGWSRDITVGGMFAEPKEVVSPDSELLLRFHLDDDGPIVTVTAKVRYQFAGLGLGVQFTDLSLADRNRIGAYVSKGEASE